MKSVALRSGLGEVVAPQTLLTSLVLAPDGAITLDPGALHGRSAIEHSVQFVPQRTQLANPQCYWLIWVAVELDASDQPLRYKGLAVSELWIDGTNRLGYKVLAEHVNRMSEALRGGVNLKSLDANARALIARQLTTVSTEVWERSAMSLKDALRHA